MTKLPSVWNTSSHFIFVQSTPPYGKIAVTIRTRYVEEKTRDALRTYGSAGPNGVSKSCGAVKVDDEVAVRLKEEIHAMIEAGEGCIGGSNNEMVG